MLDTTRDKVLATVAALCVGWCAEAALRAACAFAGYPIDREFAYAIGIAMACVIAVLPKTTVLVGALSSVGTRILVVAFVVTLVVEYELAVEEGRQAILMACAIDGFALVSFLAAAYATRDKLDPVADFVQGNGIGPLDGGHA